MSYYLGTGDCPVNERSNVIPVLLPATPETIPSCQARPAAALRGYRQGEDALCASQANTTVEWRGASIPVCRMHESQYARLGDEAEAFAYERWGWR